MNWLITKDKVIILVHSNDMSKVLQNDWNISKSHLQYNLQVKPTPVYLTLFRKRLARKVRKGIFLSIHIKATTIFLAQDQFWETILVTPTFFTL